MLKIIQIDPTKLNKLLSLIKYLIIARFPEPRRSKNVAFGNCLINSVKADCSAILSPNITINGVLVSIDTSRLKLYSSLLCCNELPNIKAGVTNIERIKQFDKYNYFLKSIPSFFTKITLFATYNLKFNKVLLIP